VTSFNRPGGNVTASAGLRPKDGKRVALLHSWPPAATAVPFCRHQQPGRRFATATRTGRSARDWPTARCLESQHARRDRYGVCHMLQQGPGRWSSPRVRFFVNRRAQIIELAARHAIPCYFLGAGVSRAGGLMSYGNNLADRLSPQRRFTSDGFSRATSRRFRSTDPRNSSCNQSQGRQGRSLSTYSMLLAPRR